MKRLGRLIAFAAVAIAAVVASNAGEQPPPVVEGDAARSSSMVLGNATCAGQGCHGKPFDAMPVSAFGTDKDFDRWKSSHAIWYAGDPHAGAYLSLTGELGQSIGRKLGVVAHEHERCLACHVTPTLSASANHPLHSEGVGCEACHGSAKSWVDAHTTNCNVTGLTRLNDIGTRAAVCAGCHLGAPAADGLPLRDMNHDMIAAGHPPLRFDYATYARALPPHWLERDRKKQPLVAAPTADEAMHWIVGRDAQDRSSLTLLADRASRPGWPELAEFDCVACHHDLPGVKSAGRVKPGAFVWHGPDATLAALIAQRPMATAEIAAAAHRAATRPRETSTFADLFASLRVGSVNRWEDASRAYYALSAVQRSGTKVDAARLDELRQALLLPRTVDGITYTTPKDFDAVRVGKLVRDLVPPP